MIATFAWLCCVSPIAWVCSAVLTASGQVRLNSFAIIGAAIVKCLMLVLVVLSGLLELAPMVAVGGVAVEGCCS